LLAEDDSDDVLLMGQALKKASVTSRLHVVCDGVEALEYLKGEGNFNDRVAHPFPDMLLLDLNLPRVNGFQVLERVRRDPACKRLIVHVLTTSSQEVDAQRAYELGASSYVLKPSGIDALADFVTALHYWHRFVLLPK
jgi:two-component system response regulator